MAAEAAPVRRAVTTRAGGISAPPYDSFNLGSGVGDEPVAVRSNRARLAGLIGVPALRLAFCEQVHGDTVAVLVRPPAAAVTATDALVTTTRDVVLTILVADCVPVLYADGRAGVAGAAHAGRRGAAAGIALRTLQAMCGVGARTGSIDVLLGPAICGRCYEVPESMQAAVEATLPGSACRSGAGTPGLDLRAGLARQLSTAGVGSITVDPRCTSCDPQFFSYRRDGVTGRQAGLAWIGRER